MQVDVTVKLNTQELRQKAELMSCDVTNNSAYSADIKRAPLRAIGNSSKGQVHICRSKWYNHRHGSQTDDRRHFHGVVDLLYVRSNDGSSCIVWFPCTSTRGCDTEGNYMLTNRVWSFSMTWGYISRICVNEESYTTNDVFYVIVCSSHDVSIGHHLVWSPARPVYSEVPYCIDN